MENFTYKNPTKIIFGEGQIKTLRDEIPANKRILLLYGGGSIKTNGIYEQVLKTLEGYDIVEFGGVLPNPEYELLEEAVVVIKKEKRDFILAVGGGSVIDAAKFLSAASLYEGDTWEMIQKRAELLEVLPFASILTLPATGSEMNSGFVLSRTATKEKLSMGSPLLFPKFSVLDPTVITTIPKHQIVNGIVDAMNHTFEQYLTYPVGGALQDRFAEGILLTLIEEGKKVVEDATNYEAAASFMWSCTLALNGLIAQGVPTDWAVHGMGHELTALFGIDHACTLAIIGPNHYRYNMKQKKEKLAQFAERVWGIDAGTVEEKAQKGVDCLVDFYHSLGVKTRLSDYVDNYKGTAEIIAQRFTDRGWSGIGEKREITPKDVAEILKMSY